MTALSETFPFKREREQRDKLKQKLPEPLIGYEPTALEEAQYRIALVAYKAENCAEERLELPSLRTLMLHRLRTSRAYSQRNSSLRSSGLLDTLNSLSPFYYLHPTPEQLESREGRRGVLSSRKIIITPATLVVVPSLLVKQWSDEIEQHVEVARTGQQPVIRTIILRTSRDPFPSPEDLSRCDLLLMSSARFSDAADDPKCNIRQVHFKRAIVDEGHTLGSSQSRMQKLAEQVRIYTLFATVCAEADELDSYCARAGGL